MSTKRKSPLKDMIDESLAKLQNSGFEVDPLLDDDRQISGPERFAKGQKAKDEVIIDSQLSDIVGREGYFLKLKKELRPGLGEWMLMKTIETEWRQWADTETEVARIVKEHTKTAPIKWGTGPYRIEYACKGGMRGKTYPPKDFYINAEEEFLNPNTIGVGASGVSSNVDSTTQVTAQLDMLGRLLDVTRGFQPAPIDPAVIQKQNADAFQQGLAIKANEGNASTQMMTAMMTGLVGMMTAMVTNKPIEAKVANPTEGLQGMLETLKTFGVIGQQNQVKEKSVIDFIGELKLLGMDLFKKEDPLEQIGKLKQLASIAGDFMGMGGTTDKPGILEKIVDMVGPAIPGMIKDLKDTATNAVAVQIEAGKNIERARIPMQTQISQGGPVETSTGTTNTGSAVNPQIQAFFNGLHEAVKVNNRMFYPIIYTSLLQEAQGVALVNGIVAGSHTAKELIELLQGYGDARFKESEFVMKRLVSYVNGFIIWLRDMVKPKTYGDVGHENSTIMDSGSNGSTAPKGAGVDIGCMTCNTVFVYESLEEFMQEENKVCGNNGCVGALQPLTKVV